MLLVAITVCSITARGQNVLLLQNNTGKEINAAYAYYDNVQNCYVSVGWFRISGYNNATISLDDLNLGNNVVYVHAHNFFKTWGSVSAFCVNEFKAFNILYADQINCSTRKNFNQIKVGAGRNTYTFNP